MKIRYMMLFPIFVSLSLAQGSGRPIPVTESFLWGRLIGSDELAYPLVSRALVPGVVLFSVEINERGAVASLRRLKGHPLLNESAEAFVSSMRFIPYERGSEPRRMAGLITVHFDFATPMVGVHSSMIRVLENDSFLVAGKSMDAVALSRWLQEEEVAKYDKIVHVLVHEESLVNEAISLLRGSGIRNLHILIEED